MKKIHAIITGCIAMLLLQSCTGVIEGTVHIDNPTESSIEVTLGEETVVVSANDTLEKKMAAGSYDVSMNGEVIGTFEMANLKEGILNPTRYEYVLGEAYYAYDQDTEYPLEDRIFELNGRKYYGPFVVNDSLFIEKDWDYDLGVALPLESNDLSIGDVIIKTKIFYFDEFETEYNDYHGTTEEEIEEYFSE